MSKQITKIIRCPFCYSSFNYWKVKEETFQCRGCGKQFVEKELKSSGQKKKLDTNSKETVVEILSGLVFLHQYFSLYGLYYEISQIEKAIENVKSCFPKEHFDINKLGDKK